MKRFFKRLDIPQILWALLFAGALAYFIWGPDAPTRHPGSSSPELALPFGLLAVLLIGAAVLFRAVPSLAYRERRLPDGFAWRRPPVRHLVSLAGIAWAPYLLLGESNYALEVWRAQDWLRIAIVGGLGLSVLAVILIEIRRLFDTSVVLSVTSSGLTVGKRAIAWSQVEAAVFDRYGWHEFAVVLVGSDDDGPREWRFSLADAGIEAPHFLDRLERAAPRVEVLKPKGEPMAGAHPIPAA